MGRIRPRALDGMSAVLLPYADDGPDYALLATLIQRTVAAGLTPAVNMDTGYINLLTREERLRVLAVARRASGERSFVAGAFVGDAASDLGGAYRAEVDAIRDAGGQPILFQCGALKRMTPAGQIAVYREVARGGGPLLAFELGEMFAPFGFMFEDETFHALLEIPEIVGMKHSSLRRALEWRRLEDRDRLRPEFRIYTGNDLAIDMVMYGSDYLLGLSAFHPEAFALRDRLFRADDPDFFVLNDLLQYLGHFAFRAPTPAYKHSAAQFLHLRGLVPSPRVHPRADRRPAEDMDVLAELRDRLDALVASLT